MRSYLEEGNSTNICDIPCAYFLELGIDICRLAKGVQALQCV
jgi:hypothetical protein